MIVDAHLHLTWAEMTPRKMLDRGLVDVVALSSLQGAPFLASSTCGLRNDHVFRWMEEYPGRVVGFAYVNPRLGDEGVRELGAAWMAA